MRMCGEVAERSKALRQGRNLFGGVGSNPTLVTLAVDRMAEWSKAPDPSSGLFGGAGSNPAPVILDEADSNLKVLTSGFEPRGSNREAKQFPHGAVGSASGC